jgi:hypothetical protein
MWLSAQNIHKLNTNDNIQGFYSHLARFYIYSDQSSSVVSSVGRGYETACCTITESGAGFLYTSP